MKRAKAKGIRATDWFYSQSFHDIPPAPRCQGHACAYCPAEWTHDAPCYDRIRRQCCEPCRQALLESAFGKPREEDAMDRYLNTVRDDLRGRAK